MSSPDTPRNADSATVKLAIPFIVGLVIWFLPHPAEIDPAAWHLLAVFVATIVGIIVKPMPMGAVAMMGILASSFVLPGTNKEALGTALSGFSNRVIWLIVAAFFISRGFIKTGLGERIAYLFMSKLGGRTLSLGYGLVATDLIMAPAIPSNTARGGGVIFPIVRSVSAAYGSEPDDETAGRIGRFLTQVSFQGLVVTSAMFLTAMAANPLAQQLAADVADVEITWTSWAVAALVPGLISLAFVPWLIFKLDPPEITETPEATEMAKKKLTDMGPMSRPEWIMAGTFVLLILLWVFGDNLGDLYSTTAALIGLVILLLTKVLTWDDVLEEKGAWDTLVWFAALVMMASQLSNLGLIDWFSAEVGDAVSGMNWVVAGVILALAYFYSHYFFASNTAHVSAMYAAFLAVAVVVGVPAVLAALVLAFFSNLFSSMTHYGTGPAPVYFGSGYVSMERWWKNGFIISVANIVIWLGIGGVWWKILGHW